MSISQKRFEALLGHVSAITPLARPNECEYLDGYRRGLRRLFYGARYENDEKHEMCFDREGEFGRGYRDGFSGLDLRLQKPSPSTN